MAGVTNLLDPPDIDINDGRLYDDPWATYRWLRENDPCYWDATNELWVISRHEDVAYISKGVLAPSNAALVERAVGLAGALGREVATREQARELLHLG